DRNYLLNQIKIFLGSYAAEQLKLKITTAGVDSDFASALGIARNMVWRWGMGRSGLLGNFDALTEYASGPHRTSPISADLQKRLDDDVQDILQACLKDVQAVLSQEQALLDRLAQELVAKEELNYDEIEAIFKEFGKSRAQ
ncbi:MAG TPA: hypothetical protein PK562_07735, partial [Candidatus Omnitrophota bacterium]|nr:hypothetical protein [Candidatus Omnitrophota bacterium]